MTMLKVSDLNVYYGNVHALKDITLEIDKREVVTFIGANGAGKTTLMMTISGILKPKKGIIEFLGSRIDGMKAHKILRLGIAQVTQNRNLFPEMTVLENIELGAYLKRKDRTYNQKLSQIYNYFYVLEERKHQKAGLLSGGEQRMLAFARALMSDPQLILLDEPSEGLAPIIIQQLSDIIRELSKKSGLTTLIVEQNASLALELAERGYVLESGVMVAEGTTQELGKRDIVKKAYLGI